MGAAYNKSCSSIRILWGVSFLVLVVISSAAAAATVVSEADEQVNNYGSSSDNITEYALRQIEWVRSNGGFVSADFEIRQTAAGTTRRAFAKNDIAQGDLILEIPAECCLTATATALAAAAAAAEDGDDDETALLCDTTRQLLLEMERGSESNYFPYVDYLTTDVNKLPSLWSEAGKTLFEHLVGTYYDDEDDEPNFVNTLPPLDPTSWIDHEWKIDCEGNDDLQEQLAFMTVIQRRRNQLLIPLYDMMGHGNGRWLNTRTTYLDSGVQVRASKLIPAGNDFFTSFNQDMEAFYGTPEIFRDNGYLEPFPQTFVFGDVAFSIDQKHPDDNDESEPELQVTWLSETPLEDIDIDFFENEIEYLHVFEQVLLSRRLRHTDVPYLEWDMIVAYHKSIQRAWTSVANLRRQQQEECDAGSAAEGGAEDSTAEKSCQVSSLTTYDKLDTYVDLEIFNQAACDQSISLDTSRFDQLDLVKSPYQAIEFILDPANNDVCFHLDGTLQICGNYRPHYHEMVVHYPARYLKDVKRVLWVGGGDSMLLHEVLKYPNLELAIGLELDQEVTRFSFKHFGSQPHWDNEKVQWWYGDAAKSLLMLPKEYFGSFDMVLVDLSETVMSMTVTKDLDILAALSLLIKPDGVFVKNELYLEKVKDIFQYAIQVEIDDVPMLCSQTLVVGSNSIDFAYTNLTDHGVETLLDQLEEEEMHDALIIDYVRNPAAQQFCNSENDVEEPVEQTISPGIVMIIEAEQAEGALAPAESVKDAILAGLGKEGFTILSAFTSDEDIPSVTVVMVEGYVVARTWPEFKYCAYDIHLWSGYGKLDSVKTSLLDAIGSNTPSSSSFRIVTAGMFGVPKTWKYDEMMRGPKFTQECDDLTKQSRDAPMSEALINSVMEGSLDMLSWDDVVAVVFCGSNDKPCNSIDIVAKDKSVQKVIPIFTCPAVVDGVEYQKDAAQIMLDCENAVWSALMESTTDDSQETVSDGNKISLIVLDPEAPYEMAQILHKIASRPEMKKYAFAYDVAVLTPIVKKEQTWRRFFMDKFLELWYQHPGFRSEVLFNSTDSNIEMDVFVSGDYSYLGHLETVNAKIEELTGLVADVRCVHSGLPAFDEDFVPSLFTLPSDYDQTGPYSQWLSQQVVGLQTVFQMAGASRLSKDEIKLLLEQALSKLNISPILAPTSFEDLGEGVVVFTSWQNGNAVVFWDGRDNIGINVFTAEEDVAFAGQLAEQFLTMKSTLVRTLRDQMPRGYGRVVNLLEDIGKREGPPHWAFHL